MTEEENRLSEANLGKAPWRRWGPYLSERQWGTVREDYSFNGHAWEYFPHDHARSRTYRWGEDGIAGICDDKQQLCFAVALWNGNDPILKERLFGLNSLEGNHGEDVKEYYFYLDNVPSHAYMKYLYKYPQKAYPYSKLIEVNKRRSRRDPEYELLDTGIFDGNRYFDVFIEYAKASPEDILIKITIENRGAAEAKLHVLPTIWFRNDWCWTAEPTKPSLKKEQQATIKASHQQLGDYWLYCDRPNELLFTENETNKQRLYGIPNDIPYVKDGINDHIVKKRKGAVNPKNSGTKAAAHFVLTVGAEASATVNLRLSNQGGFLDPFGDFDTIFNQRKTEADTFYRRITPSQLPDDMRNIQRQAFAGLLWNKQCYHYNVQKWLDGDPAEPTPPEERKNGRNSDWRTLDAFEIFSMPDKWEFPWFAAWDLAFHVIALTLIDPEFAKNQLILLTREWYMHPSGQVPAYEWSFGDVNPPVHAWAALRVYQIEQTVYGRKDRAFLERMFQKLVLNFTWWVNRKDAGGRNIFEGGFLGMDNIGAFDRSLGPPAGGRLEQPDGTGWMGMYCLNLLQIALELSIENPVYEDMATKFMEHFVDIADAINNITDRTHGLWDDKHGFYYSLLTTPDGNQYTLHQNSIVGVVPLFAVATNHPKKMVAFSNYRRRFHWFVKHRASLLRNIGDLSRFEVDGNLLLSIVNPQKLKRILQKVLDEQQFLSPFGVRSVSQLLAAHPFTITIGGKVFRLDYEPAESTTSLFGGNSNWRGPVWFPLNYLLIESLQKFHYYLGDDYKIEYPTGSGNFVSLWDISSQLSHRLIKIFLKDENGKRPVYGDIEKFQTDPHWQDYILFHEYFHGDNGKGLGASNQTGWTGLVAKLIQQYGEYAIAHKSPTQIERMKIGHV